MSAEIVRRIERLEYHPPAHMGPALALMDDNGVVVAARPSALARMAEWLAERGYEWSCSMRRLDGGHPYYLIVPVADDDESIRLAEEAAGVSTELLIEGQDYVVVCPVVSS